MPTILTIIPPIEDRVVLISPTDNNNKDWFLTIKQWTTSLLMQTKYTICGLIWISSAIFVIAALNVVSTTTNSNEVLIFDQIIQTLLTIKVIGNATISLFVSYVKKQLTLLASKQFNKTIIYELWRKLLTFLFSKPHYNKNFTFEEIKSKINTIENEYITTLQSAKEKFQTLLPTTIQQIETFFNILNQKRILTIIKNDSHNNTIIVMKQKQLLTIQNMLLKIESLYQQTPITWQLKQEALFITENLLTTTNKNGYSKKVCCYLYQEIYKIMIMSAVIAGGVTFTSITSIIKNNIANNLSLALDDIMNTFLNTNNIIMAFAALIIFKLKFDLIDNGFSNLKKIWLIQQGKTILQNCYSFFSKEPLIKQEELTTTFEHITNLKNEHHTNFNYLDDNLVNVSPPVSFGNTNNNCCLSSIKELTYFLTWLLPIASATTLDSLFSIFTSQISANKTINMVKNLQLLISKNNVIISIISQIGFSIKTAITDFCWKMFKRTYTFIPINFLFTLPNKLYNVITCHNKNETPLPPLPTHADLIQATNELEFSLTKSIKQLQKFNMFLEEITAETTNDTLNNDPTAFNLDAITNFQIPHLVPKTSKNEAIII